MKVLIAIDAMLSHWESVRAAVERPWPVGSSFCLLHVFKPYPFIAAPIIQERLMKNVVLKLEASCKRLRDAGWNVKQEICAGSARREINRFAVEWGADLVMIDCNDLSDLQRVLLGSTAQSVVRHAPCSVEIVPANTSYRQCCRPEGMRILAATDGSEFALAALRSLANRPWPEGSAVKLISVPECILLKDASYLKAHEVEDLGKAAIEAARKSITAGLETLSASKLRVCSEVPTFEERPHSVILNEAEEWQADMIVVGSHGWSGFDRVIMGSVSEAVALHATCSVEVIRRARGENN